MTIDELFKYSYVISINRSIQNRFISIFKQENLPIPKLFVGFQDDDLSGKKKCSLSHIALIKNAQANNYPFICIFEDDAYPCVNIKKNLLNELKYVNKDSDIFILGWCNNIKTKTYNNTFLLDSKLCGSHAYIVFNKGYQKIINLYNKISEKHIDNIFYSMVQMNNVVQCASMNLFIQYSLNTSMNNHIGYIYNGLDNKIPPSGFNEFDIYAFKKNIDISGIKQFILQQNINIPAKQFNNAILIGNDTNIIKQYNAKHYIDISNIFKIRINLLPNKKLYMNYGRRTGFFICDQIHKNAIISKNKLHYTLSSNVIEKISKYFIQDGIEINLSIDFISIIIISIFFKKVITFGVKLSKYQRQMLSNIFNIEDISHIHPELLIDHSGILNFYKNKKIIPSVLNKLNIQNISDFLLINKNAHISNKCLIIGGNPSVKTGLYGNYVDSCDRFIIRINTTAKPNGYEKYVGEKTDIIIASDFHKNHNIIIKNTNDKNITLYLTSDIRKIMQIGKSPLTTGFMAFLIALFLFNDIQLLGFGLSNDQQIDGICESFHNINFIQTQCKHNLNYEHQIIDDLIKRYSCIQKLEIKAGNH